MIIFIVSFIIILILLQMQNRKKIYDNMLNYWLILIYLFIYLIVKKAPFYLFIPFLFQNFRIPIYSLIFIILTISGGNQYVLKFFANIIYKYELPLKIYQKISSSLSLQLCEPGSHRTSSEGTGFSSKINLRGESSVIYICNYPSNYLEYLVPFMFNEKNNKICIVSSLENIVKYFYGKENVIGVKKGSFKKTQEKIKIKLEEGYNIVAYVEKDYYKRKTKYDITDLRTGIFSIAKNINCKIVYTAIDHIEMILGIFNCEFKVIMEESHYVENVNKEIENCKKFFSTNLRKLKVK